MQNDYFPHSTTIQSKFQNDPVECCNNDCAKIHRSDSRANCIYRVASSEVYCLAIESEKCDWQFDGSQYSLSLDSSLAHAVGLFQGKLLVRFSPSNGLLSPACCSCQPRYMRNYEAYDHPCKALSRWGGPCDYFHPYSIHTVTYSYTLQPSLDTCCLLRSTLCKLRLPSAFLKHKVYKLFGSKYWNLRTRSFSTPPDTCWLLTCREYERYIRYTLSTPNMLLKWGCLHHSCNTNYFKTIQYNQTTNKCFRDFLFFLSVEEF